MDAHSRRFPIIGLLASVAAVTLLLLGAAGTAAACWISDGPYGGSVSALAIDPQSPSTLYAGTAGGGVFKSTDGGAHWSKVNTGLTNLDVPALALDPKTSTILYAGTFNGYWGGSGVFKSTDGGAHWSKVNTGLTNLDVRALALDPKTPTTLYAGTGGGVFKSTDGGEHWNPERDLAI